MIKKVFRVFDSLFLEKKNADELIKGWEHKEKITEHHIILNQDSEEDIINGINHGFSATGYMLFKTHEEAYADWKYDKEQ